VVNCRIHFNSDVLITLGKMEAAFPSGDKFAANGDIIENNLQATLYINDNLMSYDRKTWFPIFKK
jgi:hypothetical protein